MIGARRMAAAALGIAMVAALMARPGPAWAAGAISGPVRGPNLTVSGFALAEMTGGPHYQLTLNFQISDEPLGRALDGLESAVRHARLALEADGIAVSQMSAQPPNLNFSSYSSMQIGETLVISLTSLDQIVKLGTVFSSATHLVGLANYNLSYGPAAGQIAPLRLQAAFADAWQNALQTAEAIARAEHLTLGPALSEAEGQSAGCMGMGGCYGAIYPGPVGPDQEVEEVTVVFATYRAQA